MPRHLRQRLRHTGHHHRIEPGGTGTQGNQRVHIGVMVFERLPGPGIEMPAGGNHHPQGENTQVDPGKLIGLGHHHRPEAHAPDHQPKAQPQADGHLHQQHLVLLLVLFLLAIVCRIRVFNHPGAVTGALHRINQRLRIHTSAGGGSIVRQVHMGMGYPGHRHQGFLDRIHTRRTGRPGHRQHHRIAIGRHLSCARSLCCRLIRLVDFFLRLAATAGRGFLRRTTAAGLRPRLGNGLCRIPRLRHNPRRLGHIHALRQGHRLCLEIHLNQLGTTGQRLQGITNLLRTPLTRRPGNRQSGSKNRCFTHHSLLPQQDPAEGLSQCSINRQIVCPSGVPSGISCHAESADTIRLRNNCNSAISRSTSASRCVNTSRTIGQGE